MQPRDAVFFCCFCGLPYQFQTYSISACIRMDGGVQDKGVNTPIPGKINKTYQLIDLIRTDKR